jgi:molybdate transport system substrate-binding protein
MKFDNFILIISILLLSSCHPEKHKLAIATAANVQYPMAELTREFTAASGVDCDVILGSSGKLTAQIRNGAPYDIFISADMKYPGELYKDGFATNRPKVYAFGRLVLWTLDSIAPSITNLDSPYYQHIAIANPETAPYGKAAVETLKYYKLFDKLQGKLVYGESISQTNQFIISRTARAGFTAKSVVLSPKMKDHGAWTEVDEKSYTPIAQGAVIVERHDKNSPEAVIFYDFIFSEKAKEILKKYGYLVAP